MSEPLGSRRVVAPVASRRWRAFGATLACAALLAGCGGGASVGVGIGVGGDGPPPSIDLISATDAAYPNDVVDLDAAVRASNGIDTVSFYRIDGGGSTLLGTLGSPPFTWPVRMPPVGGVSVFYGATACDQAGYCTDSNSVQIDVLR